MTDLEKPIVSLQQRLETLKQAFDHELAELVAEMDAVRDVARQTQSAGSNHDKRMRQLEERAEGQSALIATLTQEAQEARTLREELRNREIEIEKRNSELDARNDLIHALRQQLDEVEQIRAMARQRDKKIFEQQHELERKQQELDRTAREIESLRGELAAAREFSQAETSVDSAEIGALKAELDARKSMIRSLRADVERAEAKAAQVEEKRETIALLEASIDQHVQTIAELRRSVDAWKKKSPPATARVARDADSTLAEAPAPDDPEVDAFEAIRAIETLNPGVAPDRTLAIDMRDALTEARRQKAHTTTRPG